MRIFPQELFIKRLKDDLPRGSAVDWVMNKSIAECIDGLRKFSGKDFGSDADAWSEWWKQEKERLEIDPEF